MKAKRKIQMSEYSEMYPLISEAGLSFNYGPEQGGYICPKQNQSVEFIQELINKIFGSSVVAVPYMENRMSATCGTKAGFIVGSQVEWLRIEVSNI